MQLLKFLAIGFATAAAVTSLEGQTAPSVSNEEIKEAAAVLEKECSKDPACSKDGDANTPPNISELKERMSRNHSSFEVFKWGYRIYVPSMAQVKADAQHTKSCETGLFHETRTECYNQVWHSKIENPIVRGGTQLFCFLFIGPPDVLCENIRRALYSLRSDGGVVLSATWSKAWSPTIKEASEYYTE